MGKFKELITDPEQTYIRNDGNSIIIQPEYFSLLEIIRGLEMSYHEKQAARNGKTISETSGHLPYRELYATNQKSSEI